MSGPAPEPAPPTSAPPPGSAPVRWWQEAVFYQIYPRSFCLADPDARAARLGPPSGDPVVDGAGDLEGIRRHLDHLVWLGVDAVWLSPFYRSPMKDFGYDVADHCAIDPLFGTMDDFDRLLAEAHERSLRVIVDFVPNHTSDQHPWFLDARSSRGSRYRDFYVWRDPDPDHPDRPPNNWLRAFGEGPAWTFDARTGQWYLHLFLPEQPDLNWSNPEVVDAMEQVMEFWLARGVDGFRIDVVHGLGKDSTFPDAPEEVARLPWSALNDDERTHPILRRLRVSADRWPQEPVLVGEVFLLRTAAVAKYYGQGDELHLAFNFPPMFCPFDAGCFTKRIRQAEELFGPIGAWPTWALSSHDRPRLRTRYGGSERRARAAVYLLLGLRGTPFLFAGEELGLEDAEVPPEKVADPGGRDGSRAPLPWVPGEAHGWALPAGTPTPWLPFPPEPARRNVATLRADQGSILHLYRRLLALRRGSAALRTGELELLESPPHVVAWARSAVGEAWWVAVSFADEPVAWAPPPGERAVVEATSGGEGSLSIVGDVFAGTLGPEEAVLLRRE